MEEYAAKPIPDLASAHEAKRNYRAWPIDAAAAEHAEGLVDITALGIAGINHYFSSENPPYNQHIPGSMEQLLTRAGVADRLVAINEKLSEHNLELFVFDALRPVEIQNYFHDVWFPDQLRVRNPEWSDAQILEEVERYWAKGAADGKIDPLSPPPHTTGGAVDLTLRFKNGDPLWMGTLFDDVTQDAYTDKLERETEDWSFTHEEARKNRRLLYWTMLEAGFVNNPTEWWHYSYGDQMWAKLKSAQDGRDQQAVYSNALS